jgi:fermentation-respiration switch protein FrsA (DUF1100 family)
MNDLVSVPGETGNQWLQSAIVRTLRTFLIAAGGIYLLMILVLAFFENSLIYPGSKYPRGNWNTERFGFSEIEFRASDDTKLFGWYLPYRFPGSTPKSVSESTDQQGDSGSAESVDSFDSVGSVGLGIERKARTILHCHGNGENIAQVGAFTAPKFSQALQANVFVFDYRGFGKSDGTPNESGIYLDAEAALEWVCQKDNVRPKDVILVGHSLGGGPACYLAKKHGCKALILQRTFSSLPEAASYQYPMFPVGWIMQNRMDSATAIKSCTMPLFQSHGDQDTLIPIELGRKVFGNSPAKKKKFFEVKGMGHLDPLPENYWSELAAFLDASIGWVE